MILFIKHIPIEGPDTLGEFFTRKGMICQEVDLSRGEQLPDSLDGIEAVISLGGPMNVYEEDKHPFLKAEDVFIRKILKAEIPFLGICLGSQLLAKACQATVTKSPKKEIGFDGIQLTEEGMKDPLFKDLTREFDVYQWHEDMWKVPTDAVLLASSQGCPHQAFKVGPCAYGFQFHIEITEQTVREWCDEYFSSADVEAMKKKERMLSDYSQKKSAYSSAADQIYSNFLKIIAGSPRAAWPLSK